MSQRDAARITELRDQIERISGVVTRTRTVLPFGISEIDRRLPKGGLAIGAVHEVAGGANGALDAAAAIAFVAGIAARTGGQVLWCYSQADLFSPALARNGLGEDRVVFFEAPDDTAILGCCEEALRHGGLSAVVGEVAKLSRVSSQRLQMAAEATGTMALIVRRWKRQVDARDFGTPTAAYTRWRVTETQSTPLPVRGVGRARWFLELMRCRGGECAEFEVEACDAKGFIAIPADLADRPAAADDWRRAAS
ncbi:MULTISPECIES: ImuA family protein [Asticcacaulis]|uniref:ImuA family protein n=1 Tax=Asticcacaulis TaxID=76890 RepID=UPI001AE34D5F|nr:MULTISPECIES: damage-inducible protein [Asticcacaulis]MBP2160601.1 protein ImuA [Asticcacaulis solisilvae]MDR6801646.1 protein ImuA [Asticcacaulis sp. BE141]